MNRYRYRNKAIDMDFKQLTLPPSPYWHYVGYCGHQQPDKELSDEKQKLFKYKLQKMLFFEFLEGQVALKRRKLENFTLRDTEYYRKNL